MASAVAQRIALRAASRSLLWGGLGLLAFAIVWVFVPDLDEIGLPTILTLTALAAAMAAELRAARRGGRVPET